MSVLYAAVCLALGYALWRIAPIALDSLHLSALGDFGQLGLTILALSGIARAVEMLRR